MLYVTNVNIGLLRHEGVKERMNLEFSDTTFDHFREVEVEIESFLPMFEAG